MSTIYEQKFHDRINIVKQAADITGEVNVANLDPLKSVIPKFNTVLGSDATAIANKVIALTGSNFDINQTNIDYLHIGFELHLLNDLVTANDSLNIVTLQKLNDFFALVPSWTSLAFANKSKEMVAAALLLKLAEASV